MRIGKTIYLDHQATTPVDQRVLDAILPYFNERFGNPHSADHALGWDAARAVEDAAGDVAALIGADPNEIVFTSGATEANNLALFGLAKSDAAGGRKRVLISAIEHKSILALAPVLRERFGLKVDLIPVDAEGGVDLSALEDLMGEDVLAVSVMYVNSEIGSVQPIGQIGEIASRWGAVLHSDCAQAAGVFDLTQISQSADLVSLSAHKMYGPKGIGALYVSHGLHSAMKPMIYGGMQQELRSGTLPTPLCIGFGVAAALAAPSIAATRQTLARLRDRLVKRTLEINWPVHLNGPNLADRHPANRAVRPSFRAVQFCLAESSLLWPTTGMAPASGFEPGAALRQASFYRFPAQPAGP